MDGQRVSHVSKSKQGLLNDCAVGSRRVFGTVVEKSCIFLIDTSGSMDQHMDELKKELIHLVWEQLHKYTVRSAYSSSLPSSAKEDMFVSLFVDWLVGWLVY